MKPTGAFDGVIEKMVEDSREANARNDNDYIGDDGFLYCGNCHTRKETSVKVGGTEYRPYIPCKCRKAQLAKQEAEDKQKAEAERVARKRSESNVPALYRDATFQAFRTRKDNLAVLKIVRRYAEKFSVMLAQNKGLLLHGSVGTGKTYAAACIANYLITSGNSVYMTSTYEMLRLRNDEAEESYRDKLFGCDLLVIDDIGAERSTEFGRERVFTYIDGRCNASKPMIVTTNIDFKKMLKPDTQEEARIYDRILKRCFPVAFIGENWRKAEAKDGFDEMQALLQGDD